MKICMMSSSFADPVKEIEFAGKHDFQGFELAFEHPEATPEKILKKSNQILDTFSRYNLIRMGHTQSFVNICDSSELIRRASLQETINALEAAHRLDIGFLTIHPGFLWPVMTGKKALKKTCESLKELLKAAEELNLIIGLENLPPRFFPPRGYFSATEEFDAVFSEIASQRLKLVLDVAHASFFESDPPLKFIDKFYEKLAHVHLSDNLGQRDDHLPLGAGRVDYKTPVKELRKRKYSGTVTLEIFSRDRDYLLMSKRKIEELLR
ncbi:MAG: sugar phosphate isomerase/epimerase family protein [Candidatus Bathyarchaeaceae archaeon]